VAGPLFFFFFFFFCVAAAQRLGGVLRKLGRHWCEPPGLAEVRQGTGPRPGVGDMTRMLYQLRHRTRRRAVLYMQLVANAYAEGAAEEGT